MPELARTAPGPPPRGGRFCNAAPRINTPPDATTLQTTDLGALTPRSGRCPAVVRSSNDGAVFLKALAQLKAAPSALRPFACETVLWTVSKTARTPSGWRFLTATHSTTDLPDATTSQTTTHGAQSAKFRRYPSVASCRPMRPMTKPEHSLTPSSPPTPAVIGPTSIPRNP